MGKKDDKVYIAVTKAEEPKTKDKMENNKGLPRACIQVATWLDWAFRWMSTEGLTSEVLRTQNWEGPAAG